jgi:HNH endonuclease
MKICKTCSIEKELTEFSSSKKHKDGHMSECKNCISIKRREYYLNNIEQHKITTKKYYETNKKQIYEKIDKQKKKERDKKYSEKHKEKLKEKKSKYYYDNKDIILTKRKEYYLNNKSEINKTTNKKRASKRKSYRKRKYQYVWREILRKTLSQLKLQKKQTTLELLGYDYDILKKDLESKFKNGMTWENHGEWHVDHIIPLSLFKEGTDPAIVNRLDNLRPLWAKDNIKKHNKINNLEVEYSYLLDDFSEYLITL